MKLQFRPHHFLCTLGFEGKGYSEEFVQGFQEIADHLRMNGTAGDLTPIEVTAVTDSICAPCPNRQGTLCSTQTKIQALDNAHAAVLGIRAGDVLSWSEAKKRIVEKVTDEAFDAICAPCGWKELGVCHAALKRTREELTI